MDIGPKAYRVYRSGERLVIRFSIGRKLVRRRGFYREAGEEFYVWDMDTGRMAAKTSKQGYSRDEAVRVAREYRDRYGAYVRFGF